MPYAQPGQRLDADERRRHLLEVAGRIIGESGVAALNMERLAAEAGVSKALPYRHFQNTGEVLVSLLEEEWVWTDNEIAQRLAAATTFEEKVLAGLQPYLDAVVARGPAFPILMVERSPIEPLATLQRQRTRDIVAFWTDVNAASFGIDRRTAAIAAGIVLGAFEGAFRMMWIGRAERDRVEELFMVMVRALIRDFPPSRDNSSRRATNDVAPAMKRRAAARSRGIAATRQRPEAR
jgi:AcrR family transcriptional regulator